MKYGCIGEHLKHSFSKEIHGALTDYEYEICEIPKSEIDAFMKRADFKAINVTIPYKETVIPYLDYIDEFARAIGAVNTIVKRDGKLYGYNTDFFGMSALIKHFGIEIVGKKVAILGSGGTAKTAFAVSESLGAKEIIKVSRTPSDNAVSYEELYEKHSDTEVIINTTPVGMYPNVYNSPIDIAKFANLCGVVDAIYNPLRTVLVSDAIRRGIHAAGGLYMLVAQAVRASEIFIDTTYPEGELERVYNASVRDKENIVLIGMPGSGKSTVGKILADRLDREFIDTDDIIIKKAGMSIPEIFKKYGEPYFRELECEAVKEASAITAAVIATGGGAPMREENVRALKQNGRIYFLDRPVEALIPTDDRPLATTVEDLKRRYEERYGIYCATSDFTIKVNDGAQAVAEEILK